eukprot:GFUD01135179.1.p1 GENE.GFUD01135179.1~~GFUD01135179.1.p1  ORF type:complete len:124 (-),score=20.80 GFUD01135179.1:54-425(-)
MMAQDQDRTTTTTVHTITTVTGNTIPNKESGKGATNITHRLYHVSPELARIINMAPWALTTRNQVSKKLWAYLKAHKLQVPGDKMWFTPDNTMQPIFGQQRMQGYHMMREEYMKDHLILADKS